MRKLRLMMAVQLMKLKVG